MKTLIPAFITCFLLLSIQQVQSQGNAEINSIANFSFDNLHVFTDSTGHAGYACCYEKGENSFDGKKYVVQTFNSELSAIKAWEFACSDNERLLATSYNGADFIAIVYDSKKKWLYHKIYGVDGTGEKQFVDKLDNNSQYYFEKNMPPPDRMLYKIGDKGYLSLIPTKHNDVFTYDINIFLKSTGYERKLFTPETDVKTQQASFIGSVGELLLFYTFRKKVIASNKYESDLIALNATTGEKKFEVSTKEGEMPFLPLKVAGNTGQNDFVVLGNYFEENKRVNKTKSAGLCLLRMNSAGQILTKTKMNWKEKFDPKAIEEAEDTKDDGNEGAELKDSAAKKIQHFELHAFTQTVDGNFYIIGEAYRNEVSGGVKAANLLLLGAGLAGGLWAIPQVRQNPLIVMDMVVLHANSQMQIDSVYRFPKQEHRSLQFDMDFVSSQPVQNQFIVAYKDFNQEGDNQFAEKLLRCQNGVISIYQNPIVITGRVYRLLPVSEEEILLAEYFPKQKQILLSIKQLQP